MLFEYNKYGKPFLIIESDYFFNLSHSSSAVVCITDNQQVGIDVELIKPIDIKGFKKVFSPDELVYIMKQKNKFKGFYEIWTAKESFLKMLGKGLTVPLLSFSIHEGDNNLFKIRQPYFKCDPFLKTYHVSDDYIICACSIRKELPNKVNEISFSDLISQFTN